MSTDFMPLELNTISTQTNLYANSKSNGTTIEDLEDMGITVTQPGEDTGLDFSDYLQLMVQQLQNQTMDNTADTSDMLNQLVQMSVVQMMTAVKSSLNNLVDASTLSYAASLVGKTVTVAKYDEDGNIQELVGEVTGTGTYKGMAVIFINDEMYALSDIMAVGTLPEIPDPEEPEGGEGGDGGTDAGDGTGDGGNTETPPAE